jgi:hypothetical protein
MTTSETLRTDEGVGQVDQQQQGDDAAHDVGDHSRSNPRSMNASTANPPMVSST